MGRKIDQTKINRGRPCNQNVEYVALNNCIFDDPKVFTLMERNPEKGFTFFIKMLCYINKKDYFIKWDHDTRIDFIKEMHLDVTSIDHLLSECVDLGLFDKNIFEKENCITSAAIQKAWIKMAKRKTEVRMYSKNILIDAKFVLATCVPGFKLLNDSGDELQFLVKAKTQAKRKAEIRQSIQYDKKFVKAISKAKWEQQTIDFKAKYNQTFFNSYKHFCKIIIEQYPGILESDYQINLDEYIELFKQTKFTETDIISCMQSVAKTATFESKIFELFKQFLSKNKAKDNSHVNQTISN